MTNNNASAPASHIPEVKELMDKTFINHDFDVLLKVQAQGVKKFYIDKYPDKAEEFFAILNENFIANEIEEGRQRFGHAMLEKLSVDDLKKITELFKTEFGQKVLDFCILVKEQIRTQRNIIANNHHYRLESIAQQSCQHPLNAKA